MLWKFYISLCIVFIGRVFSIAAPLDRRWQFELGDAYVPVNLTFSRTSWSSLAPRLQQLQLEDTGLVYAPYPDTSALAIDYSEVSVDSTTGLSCPTWSIPQTGSFSYGQSVVLQMSPAFMHFDQCTCSTNQVWSPAELSCVDCPLHTTCGELATLTAAIDVNPG